MREDGGHRMAGPLARREETDPAKLRARVIELEERLDVSNKRAAVMERSYRTIHLQYMMAIGHMDPAEKAEHVREIQSLAGECTSCGKENIFSDEAGDGAETETEATRTVASISAPARRARSDAHRTTKHGKR